jgi:hypothetical protein
MTCADTLVGFTDLALARGGRHAAWWHLTHPTARIRQEELAT